MPKPGPNVPLCGAQKRQGEPGDTCHRTAGWGTDHPGYGACRTHGGNTRTHRQAAATEKAEHDLQDVLAQLEVEPVGDPLTALLQLGGQVVAFQRAVARLANAVENVRYMGPNGSEQLRAEVGMYERSLDRSAHVLGLIAKLNIEERLAGISERQADKVIAAIEAALTAAGLTGSAVAHAKGVAAMHLRSA